MLAATKEEDEADSDDEWKDIRARGAARQAIKARPAPAKVAKGVDDEGEEEVHVEEAQVRAGVGLARAGLGWVRGWLG